MLKRNGVIFYYLPYFLRAAYLGLNLGRRITILVLRLQYFHSYNRNGDISIYFFLLQRVLCYTRSLRSYIFIRSEQIRYLHKTVKLNFNHKSNNKIKIYDYQITTLLSYVNLNVFFTIPIFI